MNTIIRASSTLLMTGLLGLSVNVHSDPAETSAQVCQFVYGVHDDLLNDSQLIALDPAQGFAVTPLGSVHIDKDIEAIDLNLNKELFAASGDDGTEPGHLYRADLETGELTVIGATGFAEIDGIAFNPVDNSLWGWAQDVGLVQIDTANGNATVVSPAQGEFEDLTWNLAGDTLYVIENAHLGDPDQGGDSAAQHTLWSYNVNNGAVSVLCQNALDTLVGNHEIEALETLPDGSLMLGYHDSSNQPILAAIDPESCAVTLEENLYQTAANMPYQDIEALAACMTSATPPCIEAELVTSWQYTADSPNDATGIAELEINGVAYKEEAGRITIAINAKMGVDGITSKQAKDNHLGFADFVLDFNSVTYAVKFTTESDSNVTQQGLYRDVTFKDVTKDNAGWKTLRKLERNLKSKFSLGDIENYTYFNWYAARSTPTSIKSGTLVTDANFAMLDASELAAMGLDFQTGLGRTPVAHTFGFSFDRLPDMPGDFLGYFFTECINDGVGIMTQAPMCP